VGNSQEAFGLLKSLIHFCKLFETRRLTWLTLFVYMRGRKRLDSLRRDQSIQMAKNIQYHISKNIISCHIKTACHLISR